MALFNENCRKISRGQVWFLVDNNTSDTYGENSVQKKDRPWLIVSNNKCNQHAPVYTAVPLTTQSKSELPTHVSFLYGEKENTILCEQIRSVPMQAFFNKGSNYMFTLSEKCMAKVDEALTVQLGLSLIFPNSERFWESLEKMIRFRVKQAIEETRIEPIDVERMIAMVDSKVDATISETISVETTVEEVVEVEETVVPGPAPAQRPKRKVWSDEEKKEFMAYYTRYGAQTTALHYGIKASSVYTIYYRFRKEIYKK